MNLFVTLVLSPAQGMHFQMLVAASLVVQLKALLCLWVKNFIHDVLVPAVTREVFIVLVWFHLFETGLLILAVGFFYYFDPRVHRSIIYGDQPRNRLGIVPWIVVIISCVWNSMIPSSVKAQHLKNTGLIYMDKIQLPCVLILAATSCLMTFCVDNNGQVRSVFTTRDWQT